MSFFSPKISALLITTLTTFTTISVDQLMLRQSAIASRRPLSPQVSESGRTISFVFTPLIFTLQVESLEEFAKTGHVNRNLRGYLRLANVDEEQKELFRNALITPVEVNPVLLSRILNTEESERLLNYIGTVINIPGGSNGKFLLRGAIINAALEPEGISLINILKNLAVDVQIDLEKVLRYSQQVQTVLNASAIFETEVIRRAEIEANTSANINYSQLPDIRQRGNIPFRNETINLYDNTRQREFYAEIYYPNQIRENTPIIVISHGFSSRPEDFHVRAEHLASYGYFVIMPQHNGSDIKRTEDFLAGLSRQLFVREEFIDRPLDITYTLDEIERLNQSRWQGKLDTNNVGIFGHSFGGYTALAVAGAKIQWERLAQRCSLDIGNLNTSLLLQCRALQLPQEDYDFRDERIKAVFAINPVNASIFGPEGLNQMETPVFMAAGSYDPATPFVFELAQTYPLLTIPDTYLQLQEGQAHIDFSQLDAGISDLINTATNLTLPSPVLLDDYTNTMMLAFFEVYIRDNQSYRSYLQSGYANYLSEGEEFKTYLVGEESIPDLRRVYEDFMRTNAAIIFGQ